MNLPNNSEVNIVFTPILKISNGGSARLSHLPKATGRWGQAGAGSLGLHLKTMAQGALPPGMLPPCPFPSPVGCCLRPVNARSIMGSENVPLVRSYAFISSFTPHSAFSSVNWRVRRKSFRKKCRLLAREKASQWQVSLFYSCDAVLLLTT